MALLNLQANREGVARVQTAIVWVVIVILGGFAFITIRNADFSLLSPANYPPARSILSSVALTFFAFLGFAVVAFSAGDMKDPRRDLPKAMYLSLIITTILYVAIAIGVYGMLPLEEVIAAGNTAIAAAAYPILGSAGFVIMTICACFSTSSAVNSQFFATTGVITYLTQIGQFPPVLGNKAGANGNVGVVISTIFVSILTLLFDLSAIASIGSAVALVIFMMVGIAHLSSSRKTGANLFIIYLSIISVVVTLVVFAVETLSQEPATALAIVIFLVLSVLADRLWRGVPFLKAGEAGSVSRMTWLRCQTDRSSVGAGWVAPTRKPDQVRRSILGLANDSTGGCQAPEVDRGSTGLQRRPRPLFCQRLVTVTSDFVPAVYIVDAAGWTASGDRPASPAFTRGAGNRWTGRSLIPWPSGSPPRR